jgi:hypothetical protein
VNNSPRKSILQIRNKQTQDFEGKVCLQKQGKSVRCCIFDATTFQENFKTKFDFLIHEKNLRDFAFFLNGFVGFSTDVHDEHFADYLGLQLGWMHRSNRHEQ